MPSQCVDGHRKPPKYLNAGKKKAAKVGLRRSVTSLQQTPHQHENISNIKSYESVQFHFRAIASLCSKEITEQPAVNERYIKDYRSDPFEEVFDDVIDSNFFYTERSSFRLGREASEGNIVKENDNFTTFVSDAEFATWSERSSSVSEDSEVGTPYQALEDSFGANLAKLQSYAREEPCSGFAISSGWSSTFFPHETEQ
ncbi:hypothetical protein N7453_002106 [Penicillium expansum]|nr:hypothetical protein N7453_002106 [Penicillium expansum]